VEIGTNVDKMEMRLSMLTLWVWKYEYYLLWEFNHKRYVFHFIHVQRC